MKKKQDPFRIEIDPEILERMPSWFQKLHSAGKKRT